MSSGKALEGGLEADRDLEAFVGPVQSGVAKMVEIVREGVDRLVELLDESCLGPATLGCLLRMIRRFYPRWEGSSADLSMAAVQLPAWISPDEAMAAIRALRTRHAAVKATGSR